MSNDAQQYLFVANRDVTIGGKTGRRLFFKKSTPTHVPRMMHQMVMERGILPCNAEGVVLDKPEVAIIDPEAPKILLAPEGAEERAEAIEKVIDAIVEGNDSANFTGGGTPNAAAVTAALGWKVDQREVRGVWTKVRGKYVGSPASEE